MSMQNDDPSSTMLRDRGRIRQEAGVEPLARKAVPAPAVEDGTVRRRAQLADRVRAWSSIPTRLGCGSEAAHPGEATYLGRGNGH